MKKLTILPIGKKIDVAPGTIVLGAIRQYGIEISSLCNGHSSVCGKCKVHIIDAEL